MIHSRKYYITDLLLCVSTYAKQVSGWPGPKQGTRQDSSTMPG